jgi:hypothetical protein
VYFRQIPWVPGSLPFLKYSNCSLASVLSLASLLLWASLVLSGFPTFASVPPQAGVPTVVAGIIVAWALLLQASLLLLSSPMLLVTLLASLLLLTYTPAVVDFPFAVYVYYASVGSAAVEPGFTNVLALSSCCSLCP